MPNACYSVVKCVGIYRCRLRIVTKSGTNKWLWKVLLLIRTKNFVLKL